MQDYTDAIDFEKSMKIYQEAMKELGEQLKALGNLSHLNEFQTDEKLDPTLRNWRAEPATHAQVRYVYVLTKMMGMSGDEANAEYDFHHLDKGEMDKLLKMLEEENGIEPSNRRSDSYRDTVDAPKLPKKKVDKPITTKGFHLVNGGNYIDDRKATCGECQFFEQLDHINLEARCTKKTWITVDPKGRDNALHMYCFKWSGDNHIEDFNK